MFLVRKIVNRKISKILGRCTCCKGLFGFHFFPLSREVKWGCIGGLNFEDKGYCKLNCKNECPIEPRDRKEISEKGYEFLLQLLKMKHFFILNYSIQNSIETSTIYDLLKERFNSLFIFNYSHKTKYCRLKVILLKRDVIGRILSIIMLKLRKILYFFEHYLAYNGFGSNLYINNPFLRMQHLFSLNYEKKDYSLSKLFSFLVEKGSNFLFS
jgi:hypothetical protein